MSGWAFGPDGTDRRTAEAQVRACAWSHGYGPAGELRAETAQLDDDAAEVGQLDQPDNGKGRVTP